MNVNYKELKIWQRSVDFCTQIYIVSKQFPESEKFGLTNQIRRAAVSIPSNIAEGAGRKSKADFIRFLRITEGSINEVETQIIIAQELKFIDEAISEKITNEANQILKMIGGFVKKLKSSV